MPVVLCFILHAGKRGLVRGKSDIMDVIYSRKTLSFDFRCKDREEWWKLKSIIDEGMRSQEVKVSRGRLIKMFREVFKVDR